MGQAASSAEAACVISRVVEIAATCKHMEAGGCKMRLLEVLRDCADGKHEDGSKGARQCAEATAALRRCMEANAGHFRDQIRDMDEGLDKDEKGGVEDWEHIARWRWWTGMRRTSG
uniref:GCK domain-containing protein n=1 Tax=Leersia perrieri TaxID=77586 RepID=A0A0D9WQR9_9ORYZ